MERQDTRIGVDFPPPSVLFPSYFSLNFLAELPFEKGSRDPDLFDCVFLALKDKLLAFFICIWHHFEPLLVL